MITRVILLYVFEWLLLICLNPELLILVIYVTYIGWKDIPARAADLEGE